MRARGASRLTSPVRPQSGGHGSTARCLAVGVLSLHHRTHPPRAKLRSFSRSSGVSAPSANLMQSRAFAADDMGLLSLQCHSSIPIMHFSAPSSLVKTLETKTGQFPIRPYLACTHTPRGGIPAPGRALAGGGDLNARQKPVRISIRTGDALQPDSRSCGYSTLSGILATLINGRASWLRS